MSLLFSSTPSVAHVTYLFEGLHDARQVKLSGDTLAGGQGLSSVSLLNSDVNKAGLSGNYFIVVPIVVKRVLCAKVLKVQ